MPQFTQTWQVKMLDELTTSSNSLTSLYVNLFTNNHNPGPSDTYNSYTLVTSGEMGSYAAIAVEPGGVINDVDGATADCPMGEYQWVNTGGTGCTIYGWMISKMVGSVATLVCAELLPEPVTIVNVNDGLTVSPSVNCGLS